MMPKVSVICTQCRRKFQAYPSGRRQYCSRGCADQAQRHRINKVCENCGKAFHVKPCESFRKYCSRHCYNQARADTVAICPVCGGEFFPRHSKQQGDQRYCSQQCAGIASRKRVTIYCQQCGQPVEVGMYRTETAEYCSRACFGKGHSKTQQGKHYVAHVTRVCKQCAGEFEVTPAILKRKNRGQFCSKVCFDKWQSQPVGCVCEMCGKEYTHPPRIAKTNRFCSRACLLDYVHGHIQSPTQIEQMLYAALRAESIDFKPQPVIPEVNTTPDALVGNIAIYCDGDYWHCKPGSRFDADPKDWQIKARARDARLTAELRAAGYTVLRFWGSQIRDPDGLKSAINDVKEQLVLMAAL